jgi:hypothetical protein
MKQSGVGRRHGAEGIVKYTEAQTVAAQHFIPCGIPPFLSERTYGAWMPPDTAAAARTGSPLTAAQ